MKKLGGIFLVVVGLAVAGCNAPTTAKPPQPLATNGSSDPNNGAKPVETGENASPVNLDDSLKSDGAEYFGLLNTKTQVYTVEGGNAPEGTQQVKFVSGDAKSATFEVHRNDIVTAGEGVDRVELKPDGVYVTKSDGGEFGKPTLELPADVKPGKTWEVNTDVTPTGSKPITLKGTYKAEAMEKVKVPAGEFDCLKVTLNAKAITEGKTLVIQGTTWYAKGVGLIKQFLKTDSSQVTITLKK
ncbi:MAG: hypothetical protein JST40_05110 [Armatimonadetes bacterium]|nr:hypothetical protein [Armatimonadota bacterium]